MVRKEYIIPHKNAMPVIPPVAAKNNVAYMMTIQLVFLKSTMDI